MGESRSGVESIGIGRLDRQVVALGWPSNTAAIALKTLESSNGTLLVGTFKDTRYR